MKLKLLIVLLIIGLLGFYVFQANAEISERFLVKECDKKIQELSKENKVLEIGFAKNGSLDRMKELAISLGLEKVDKIHYIKVVETQVVAK